MAFLGMRGTGDFATDERPLNWRETILFLYPNGDAPITAIMSKMGSERTDDPNFNWWTKNLPDQGGAATNVFTNNTLVTAYVSGGALGDTLYVQGAEAIIKHFRVGHVATLMKSGDYRFNTNAKVTARTLNGADSYITIYLLETPSATYDLDEINYILVTGNMNAEGATMPDALSYDPVKYNNYTQIFRTPLSITRTARKTRTRTTPKYQELKREALELHSIEMEKAFLWGIKYEGLGSNGKPERSTQGIISMINEYAPNNVDNYALNTEYTGDAWSVGGEDWLNERLEINFRFGSREKLAIAGSGAILGLQKLAKTGGQVQLVPGQKDYGLRVMTWMTPFGTIEIMNHPLLSQTQVHRNDMIILEPKKLNFRFIDDTFFKSDDSEKKNTNNSKDSTDEEFLTEAGMEYHHPQAFGHLSGVGIDNALT